jgi:hypothetical protein
MKPRDGRLRNHPLPHPIATNPVPTREGGFTLLDIVLVLVIAGLIVQAVIYGQGLIETARVQALVAQQSADFDRAKALEVMEAILQSNPTIDAVFCGNDAMAMGAYQALVAAGKDKQVKVFGFDGADDVVKSICPACHTQFGRTKHRYLTMVPRSHSS